MKIDKIIETPPLPPYSLDADITKPSVSLSCVQRIVKYFSVGTTSISVVLDAAKRSAGKLVKFIQKK